MGVNNLGWKKKEAKRNKNRLGKHPRWKKFALVVASLLTIPFSCKNEVSKERGKTTVSSKVTIDASPKNKQSHEPVSGEKIEKLIKRFNESTEKGVYNLAEKEISSLEYIMENGDGPVRIRAGKAWMNWRIGCLCCQGFEDPEFFMKELLQKDDAVRKGAFEALAGLLEKGDIINKRRAAESVMFAAKFGESIKSLLPSLAKTVLGKDEVVACFSAGALILATNRGDDTSKALRALSKEISKKKNDFYLCREYYVLKAAITKSSAEDPKLLALGNMLLTDWGNLHAAGKVLEIAKEGQDLGPLVPTLKRIAGGKTDCDVLVAEKATEALAYHYINKKDSRNLYKLLRTNTNRGVVGALLRAVKEDLSIRNSFAFLKKIIRREAKAKPRDHLIKIPQSSMKRIMKKRKLYYTGDIRKKVRTDPITGKRKVTYWQVAGKTNYPDVGLLEEATKVAVFYYAKKGRWKNILRLFGRQWHNSDIVRDGILRGIEEAVRNGYDVKPALPVLFEALRAVPKLQKKSMKMLVLYYAASRQWEEIRILYEPKKYDSREHLRPLRYFKVLRISRNKARGGMIDGLGEAVKIGRDITPVLPVLLDIVKRPPTQELLEKASNALTLHYLSIGTWQATEKIERLYEKYRDDKKYRHYVESGIIGGIRETVRSCIKNGNWDRIKKLYNQTKQYRKEDYRKDLSFIRYHVTNFLGEIKRKGEDTGPVSDMLASY